MSICTYKQSYYNIIKMQVSHWINLKKNVTWLLNILKNIILKLIRYITDPIHLSSSSLAWLLRGNKSVKNIFQIPRYIIKKTNQQGVADTIPHRRIIWVVMCDMNKCRVNILAFPPRFSIN
jgi:hypothetical protein